MQYLKILKTIIGLYSTKHRKSTQIVHDSYLCDCETIIAFELQKDVFISFFLTSQQIVVITTISRIDQI